MLKQYEENVKKKHVQEYNHLFFVFFGVEGFYKNTHIFNKNN